MALRFLLSSDISIDVVVTCDDAVECNDEQRTLYLDSGDQVHLESVNKNATRFKIKALSPREREDAEAAAGALTRSELGRLLWAEAPEGLKDRAKWHHALDDEERRALSDYQNYLNRVYIEMIKASLISIDDIEASADQLNLIRPESNRVQTISELVLHIQRISLAGVEGK